MQRYSFDIRWSEEDGEYVATCPSFPGLSALAETEEEALMEAKVALNLFIESYQERGIPLPEANTVQDYSGQIRLRLPKSLHGQAAKAAAEDGISLNQLITLSVQARVSGQEVARRISREVKEHLITHSTPPLRRTENRQGIGKVVLYTPSNQESSTNSELAH
jgi:predicted RNase H-like HicB family nuclease